MSEVTDRLVQYNGGVYDAATNPRGFDGADSGVSGLEANLPQALNDVGTAAGEIADLIGANRAVGPSLPYAWDSGTGDADPGTGEARANDATLASATQLYVSTTDAGGAAVAALLDAWDDSTSTVKGRLRLAHRTDAAVWAEFAVTGSVVSATGYRKVTVGWLAGSGTLSAADPVALGFVRTGDKGDTGTVAAAGDGSAGTPAHGFASESGLGLFRLGTRQLAVAVGAVLHALFTGPATAVSYWVFGSAPSSTDEPYISIGSSDANVGAQISTKGTGPLKFMTSSRQYVQALVEHVAGNRWLIFRGSSGGAPTIATSAGDLALAPASGIVTGVEFAWVIALSDETTTILTGTAVVTLRAPFPLTLTRIPRASLGAASSSGAVTVDIKAGGTSVLGADKLSIDATEKTSTTAATATTLATTSIADDAEITFDIVGAGSGAKAMKVVIFGKRV